MHMLIFEYKVISYISSFLFLLYAILMNSRQNLSLGPLFRCFHLAKNPDLYQFSYFPSIILNVNKCREIVEGLLKSVCFLFICVSFIYRH